jgi:alpha-tubulin suppressor-like RCC1 family protein
MPISGGLTFRDISVGSAFEEFDLTFRDISVGSGFEDFACGVTDSGTGYCWGDNAYGELGDSSLAPRATAPSRIAGGLTFASIMAGVGSGVACGVTTNGDGYCWGSSSHGHLGDSGRVVPQQCDSSLCSPIPFLVAGHLKFRTIGVGNVFACGLTQSGQGYCWGRNTANFGGQAGQLGVYAEYDSALAPVPIIGSHSFAAMSVGMLATCGITTTEAVLCWGATQYGLIAGGGSLARQASP